MTPNNMTRDPKVLFGDGTELLHAYPFLYIGSFSFTLQFFSSFWFSLCNKYPLWLPSSWWFPRHLSLSLIEYMSFLVDPAFGNLISWSLENGPHDWLLEMARFWFRLFWNIDAEGITSLSYLKALVSTFWKRYYNYYNITLNHYLF